MKHNFSIRDIVGALKTVRGVKNYYSDAQLAHLVDEAREVNAILDALPDPDPVTDEWEKCEFSDIRKGDRVKRVVRSQHGQVTTNEGVASDYETETLGGPLAWWFNHAGSGDVFLARNDEPSDRATLYRIPAPVQHPNPEQHPVIFVGATEYREGDGPFAAFRYGDKYKAQWHDQPITLSPESITDWWPALVVADDRGDA